MILKNVASQGVYIFAYTASTGAAKTGDAANITGSISKDGAASASFGTTNPTEIGGGIYWQPLSQAETNANAIAMYWASGTSGVLIDPLLVLTSGVNFPTAAYAASGGFLTYGSSTGQINPSSGKVPATLASTDVTGNVACDLQTIKTQTVTVAAGVTFPTSIASPTNITSATGVTLAAVTHTGAVIPTVTSLTNGVNVTQWGGTAVASAYIQSNAAQFAGQAITCAGPVTVPSATLASTTNITGGAITTVSSVSTPVTVGTNNDKTGYSLSSSQAFNLTGNITGNLSGSVGSVSSAVVIDQTATLGSPRALDSVADGSLKISDALHCAIAAAAGKETVSGVTYTVRTPSTGTTIRQFTLDSASNPTSRS